jgi:hypothetical protein
MFFAPILATSKTEPLSTPIVSEFTPFVLCQTTRVLYELLVSNSFRYPFGRWRRRLELGLQWKGTAVGDNSLWGTVPRRAPIAQFFIEQGQGIGSVQIFRLLNCDKNSNSRFQTIQETGQVIQWIGVRIIRRNLVNQIRESLNIVLD